MVFYKRFFDERSIFIYCVFLCPVEREIRVET
jgi:hypothetical protein